MVDRRFASPAVWTVRVVALATALALLWWSVRLLGDFQVYSQPRTSLSTGASSG